MSSADRKLGNLWSVMPWTRPWEDRFGFWVSWFSPSQQVTPPEPLAHILLGGMGEHWKSKSENTCKLRHRQFNRESKRHVPKQSKARNMDRQMFQISPRREGFITWSKYLGRQITITLHVPCFFPRLLCAEHDAICAVEHPCGQLGLTVLTRSPLNSSYSLSLLLVGWDEKKRPQQCISPAQQQLNIPVLSTWLLLFCVIMQLCTSQTFCFQLGVWGGRELFYSLFGKIPSYRVWNTAQYNRGLRPSWNLYGLVTRQILL